MRPYTMYINKINHQRYKGDFTSQGIMNSCVCMLTNNVEVVVSR